MYKLVIVPPKTEPNALFKLDGDKVIMSIPFDPANTDYQNFKYQINHDEAQLETADGVEKPHCRHYQHR